MSEAPICFRFPDEPSARLALETLRELGYHVHPAAGSDFPALELFVRSADLTSALEVAQSHGGEWLERPQSLTEAQAYQDAYPMDGIAIPAHVVNEDWVEGFAQGKDNEAYEERDYDDGDRESFDPSDDGYDHFSPGIHV